MSSNVRSLRRFWAKMGHIKVSAYLLNKLDLSQGDSLAPAMPPLPFVLLYLLPNCDTVELLDDDILANHKC